MNRHLQRVFSVYALCLAFAVLYVPWRGAPHPPWLGIGHLEYGWLWRLPSREGFFYVLDFPRLLLEILSLSLVMLVAAMVLGDGTEGEKRAGTARSDRPRKEDSGDR